jgi:hydrogenase nickel incorporation protein HypB
MSRIVVISEDTPRANDALASENRGEFVRHGVFVTSLAGASGSGKTSLLERTIPLLLGAQYRVGVIVGDVETDRDGRRLATLDVPVVQIITNGTCHLEARMISDALRRMDLEQVDLLFIENVGGLICPASYDLGEHLRVVVMSVTEGEDKPLKYPGTFRRSHGLVITKTDLLPFLSYNLAEVSEFALAVNVNLRIFPAASTTGKGIREWADWLLCAFRRCVVPWDRPPGSGQRSLAASNEATPRQVNNEATE